jgi:hypothetical protein
MENEPILPTGQEWDSLSNELKIALVHDRLSVLWRSMQAMGKQIRELESRLNP